MSVFACYIIMSLEVVTGDTLILWGEFFVYTRSYIELFSCSVSKSHCIETCSEARSSCGE